jgi:hypothetical protein
MAHQSSRAQDPAGAGNGEPTYFDVCVGADREILEHCGG